uniref:Dehydroascorbate reductase 2 n=1 Tax=Tanacetum cinerariifolium TaxID=118510 RepID=A0A6L2P4J6_TANCI|nr:dehydroascorbate reductase 2 [Tanacetum cinerariifolium]
MKSLDEAAMGGHLKLVTAIVKAHTVWFGCWNKELGNHLPKRIAVFAGGRVFAEMGDVQKLGKAMKDMNVACDVISFGDPARNKQQLFKTLIDVADNNGNCNLLYVPPDSTVRDALLRSQIIQSSSSPFATLPVQPESSKENIMAAAALYSVADNTDVASLSRSRVMPHVEGSGPLASSVHQESSKPDKKAAANYPESVDLHDHPAKINALSQSVVDLKLENVKPNSQPETLDQRIERVK